MLNKENYVPWSLRLLRYAKSRPNGKLIYNSIINGPYVRRMIPEPSDANHAVPVENNDQAIQTILLGLPEDIYDDVDSCETAQEIWFTSTNGESIESYYHHFLKLMNDFKRNKHSPEKIASNFKFLNNLQPEWSRHVTIVHQTKDLHTIDYTQLYDFLKYNQEEMVRSNGGNQFIQYVGQNVGNQNGYNAVQNVRNQNLNGNGNVIAAQAEGNAIGNNGNQIRCYNCIGLGHLVRNCTVRPRRRDVAYLQTQLLIAQKEEAGIQLQAEEFDLIVAVADLDEIEETDKAPVYDSDELAEVHHYDNCYNNDIFNMFTQEEQYTELLKPILEPHQVQPNDSNVISEVSSMEQSGGTVDQHPATVEETCAYFESLYNNLAIEAEKVNSVNHRMKETNTDLTTKLARYKNQEKCFEISQEKYDKLEKVCLLRTMSY
ncbi:ribonuclease H-like domain-containing protein [Tanacetum coccineum]